MRRLIVGGLTTALTLVAFVLAASAQTRAPFWPATTGKAVLTEWYSDLPWTQKLGTYRGNEIDQAFVLPYAALSPQNQAYCNSQKLSQERCMIETGVNSVLGILRTDTLYLATDPLIKAATRCQPNFNPATGCSKTLNYCLDSSFPCIEVKLALSMFFDNVANNKLVFDPLPFGTEPVGSCPPPDPVPSNCIKGAYYGGYVITDGSSYAPQMPWYMSHYCDLLFQKGTNDVQDPACYADYLSPMNDGFNAAIKPATGWPNSVQPWSVYPTTKAPAPDNHCPAGQTACTLVMGAFDLDPVSPVQNSLQYPQYNGNLLGWFNNALAHFPNDFSTADLQRHFPWNGAQLSWATDLYPQAVLNPFLGQFAFAQTADSVPTGCDVNLTGPTPPQNCADMTQTKQERADHFLYPRKCSLADLANLNAAKLRQCGLNYELHHNGWLAQWPNSFWPNLPTGISIANQYGRTSFLFAGVPGIQLPVSFFKDPKGATTLSVYEQVHNASLFSLYLPIANEADITWAYNPDAPPGTGRNYTDDFFHTLLMSNHNEAAPEDFAEGIRGKVLWHDEYRSQKMYIAFTQGSQAFPTRTFPAAFDPATAPAPFHNNTCDGCHLRNGSGIPINTTGKLDVTLQEFMTSGEYNPYKNGKDYTFTGQIRPMKLVFFDLSRVTNAMDDSVYSEPLTLSANPAGPGPGPLYYHNKIMNFYGDSFHVTRQGYSYDWSYGPANLNRIVVNTPRINSELNKTYTPQQLNLGTFQTSPSCQLASRPTSVPASVWPANCSDINGAAITAATNSGAVGYMLLNGKRLGNSGAIEAIPNAAIQAIQQNQVRTLGAAIAGEILWNSGTRGGVDGTRKLSCSSGSLANCYIGRFGWLGDRVSLEDQVANAAFVEMNMTTSMGYKQLYPNGNAFPIRYNLPNCGPADQVCITSKGNADLLEEDIDRMADYARWLGSPTRSEFTVSLPDVIAGEKIFNQVNCNQCHVIAKISIPDPNDTMLTPVYRARLATHIAPPALPFLSYLGTDLLMHDMGYLSQAGNATNLIRDQVTGVVFPQFKNYVQKIRTPPLKGLRFNRFVTDSHLNTIPATPPNPGCDFLLHDGRACDAIEAAFLHDGPAIKKLGVIPALNALTPQQLQQLRAFLYSL